MPAQFAIGIDLGTTNSVLAYVPLKQEGDAPAEVGLLPIPQLVAAGTVEEHSTLPSFLYLPTGHEDASAFALPWDADKQSVVGRWARTQSAEVPDRTVGAAKSWLCHAKVDRHANILPWGAPDEVNKVSPVTASQRYLEHLVAAWNRQFPDVRFADQHVVLTVPASFDASARELTHEAALGAGLPVDFVLLEEPQAAVYAWLLEFGEKWRKLLKPGETLLVVDVGGGTTDLSLVSVDEEQGNLVLQRKAVGDHLLVGGDNMDLALAHHVAEKFREKGVNLDAWQSVSLWHSCRDAKEILLADDGPESHTISVLGRGSRLIGGTVSVDVDRATVQQLLLDGFWTATAVTDHPQRRRASGFQEIGLPFESDPSITRHLAAFLSAHGSDDGPVRPTHVLVNGGVFKSERFSERMLETLAGWFPGETAPDMLAGVRDLDHAVARGAAHYARTKQQGGVRIRGGAARSYYVGIETAGPAIPGAPRPLRALCVVPIGMEEGSETDVPSAEIGLYVGEPASFRFFKSSVRKQDQPGDVLSAWTPDELEETAPLETTLAASDDLEDPNVPVKFHAKITELGLFELWCVSQLTGGPWKLEFSVREDD